MTKKTKISYLLLVTIFLFGLFLRLYHLDIDTPAIYADEAGHYYNFQHFKNWDLSVGRELINLLTSATWLVGLNPLGVRLFSALYGSSLVILGFFFARSVAKQSGTNLYLRIALAFSFLTAILPWNFAISRLGHTHIPLVVLMSLLHLGIYINAKNWLGKIASLVPYVIGGYFYPSLFIMSPLTLLIPAVDFLTDKKVTRFARFGSLGLFLFVVSYFLVVKYQVFSSQGRGLDLAIWRDINVTADSNLYRGLARNSNPTIFSFYQDPEKIANKIVFNYPVSVLSAFAKNYLSFFSPEFLFLKGDKVLRHSTGMVGNFYLFLLPFMLYGIYKFYALNTKHSSLITLWILASPLPAAITKDGAGYLLRAITLMPFLTYFCSLGIVYSFELFKNNFSKMVYGIILGFVALFSAYYYFYGYFHVYPSLAADSFEYGFKELSDFQLNNPGKMLIIWDDKYPFGHFCFWQKLPYGVCEYSKTNTRVTVGQSRVDLPLPNIFFSLPESIADLALITNNFAPKYLVIPKKYKENFFEIPPRYRLVDVINNPDQSLAFEIYED